MCCLSQQNHDDMPWTGGYDPEDFERRKLDGAAHYHQKVGGHGFPVDNLLRISKEEPLFMISLL
jgi:hypothetical protein